MKSVFRLYFEKGGESIHSPNGEILAKYIYDAWGNCKVIDANGYEITSDNYEGFRNPIRYRGYFYDVETGLYFLKSRYYDPETGRFISPEYNNGARGWDLFGAILGGAIIAGLVGGI